MKIKKLLPNQVEFFYNKKIVNDIKLIFELAP